MIITGFNGYETSMLHHNLLQREWPVSYKESLIDHKVTNYILDYQIFTSEIVMIID